MPASFLCLASALGRALQEVPGLSGHRVTRWPGPERFSRWVLLAEEGRARPLSHFALVLGRQWLSKSPKNAPCAQEEGDPCGVGTSGMKTLPQGERKAGPCVLVRSGKRQLRAFFPPIALASEQSWGVSEMRGAESR